MKITVKYLTTLILIIVLIISCEEEPTSVGSKLIPGEDLIDALFMDTQDSTFAQQTSYYYEQIDVGNASRILLGKHLNVESSVLLRFFIFLPESIYTPLRVDSILVREAWVEMNPNYTWGSNSAPFDFSGYKINQDWTPADFDKDSLQALNIGTIDISSNRNIADTLVSFDIDTNLVLEWMKDKIDDSDTIPDNNGIYIKATSATDKIIGFPALSSNTSIKISTLKMVVEKPGLFIDTLVATPSGGNGGDVHVIDATVPTTGSENILLQGGLAVRAKFWMDFSWFSNKSIVNRAILYINVDSLETVDGSVSSDSILVNLLSDSTDNTIVEGSEKLSLKRNGNIFIGELTSFLQYWINGGDNQGILLTLADENKSFAKIVLKGSQALETTLRPRLKIYYSVKR